MSNAHVHPAFAGILDTISGATTKSDAAREMEKAMGPDHSREGIFVYHNCYRCDHGKKPCVQGGSHRCEYPHARND